MNIHILQSSILGTGKNINFVVIDQAYGIQHVTTIPRIGEMSHIYSIPYVSIFKLVS